MGSTSIESPLRPKAFQSCSLPFRPDGAAVFSLQSFLQLSRCHAIFECLTPVDEKDRDFRAVERLELGARIDVCLFQCDRKTNRRLTNRVFHFLAETTRFSRVDLQLECHGGAAGAFSLADPWG